MPSHHTNIYERNYTLSHLSYINLLSQEEIILFKIKWKDILNNEY